MVQDADVIDQLVDDLEPVKPVSIGIVMVKWTILAVIVGWYFLSRVGMRPDLAEKLTEPTYIIGLVFYIITFFVASAVAITMALPGREAFTKTRALKIGLSLFVCAISFYSGLVQFEFAPFSEFSGFEALGCCLRISFGALLPAAILMFIYTRLAPVNLRFSVAFGWLAAAVLVSIVSQLNCPIDGIGHVLIGHGLLLGLVGIAAHIVFVLFGSFLAKFWVKHPRS